MRRMMDWDLYLRLLSERAAFRHVPIPVGVFRAHDTRVTATEKRGFFERLNRGDGFGREYDMVRERYGAMRMRRAGHLAHGALKLADGAYAPPGAGPQLHGADLRWWASAEAACRVGNGCGRPATHHRTEAAVSVRPRLRPLASAQRLDAPPADARDAPRGRDHVGAVGAPAQLYALRETGAVAEYGHRTAARAIADFGDSLPGGRDAYLAEVRRSVLALYEQAAGDAAWFLDKTPRYHLVVDEIMALFPDARFVFLWRNPLAVAASMIESFGHGHWNLKRYDVDLHGGLERLVSAHERGDPRTVAVRFEDVVADPASGTRPIFGLLGLDPAMAAAESFADRA